MQPGLVLGIIAAYFGILIIISLITSRNANNAAFFIAERKSRWYMVAFAMIGATLSGVTFVSVPGEVGKSAFSYFQLVLGYLLGYFFIYMVLMPLYYRLNLVSIYSYLKQRFGIVSYKTGSFFFLISQSIGASFRLFLTAKVLHITVFQSFGISFPVTVAVCILLIWLYTFKGGIKTIIWTDTVQTVFMLGSIVLTIIIIAQSLNLSFTGVLKTIWNSPHSEIFTWDWRSKNNFFKQFFAGAFISIVMTGLDQNMMQKNLTCRTLREAQKNMFWFSLSLAPINLLYMSLGVLLYAYASHFAIALPANSDDLFPLLALKHFGLFAGLVFIIGIIAAAFSSADSALAALTTAFCYDFMQVDRLDETKAKKLRFKVHIGFSVWVFLLMLFFRLMNNDSVINELFKAAGYTYGPLLGLFIFGLFTKRQVKDAWVPLVAFLSPLLSYVLNINSERWFNGYKFNFEILIVNGALTFLGLWLLTDRKKVLES